MADFYQRLEKILTSDSRFIAKGENQDDQLMKNVVYEAALKNDPILVKSLYDDEILRERFFSKIDDDIYVFNSIEFGWVLNNKEFLPDSYTRFANKIGLTDYAGKPIISHNEVVLSFPYKDCILEGCQSKDDQKRQEVFYNKILAPDRVDSLLSPKVFSNSSVFSADSEYPTSSFDGNNLVIKGNNLLVISSLLKRYEGKIDCIFIDPPYNPKSDANTFLYNNTFNRSTWLTFMMNRLEVCKKLLTSDGVLIVTIDKNEQPRLQILIEELFPEYDVDCIIIVHNPRGTIGTNFSYTHENAIFVTPKNKKVIANRPIDTDEVAWSPLRNWGGESLRTDARNCFYPIIVKDEKIVGIGDVDFDLDHHPQQTELVGDRYYVYPIDSKGVERKWRYARATVEDILGILRVKKTRSGGFDIEIGKTSATQKTVWQDPKYDASTNGTQLLKTINPEAQFSYPKSLYSVMDCIDCVVREKPDATILDFFGGSGTTGHAVMELNRIDNGHRKFILVEQMDYIKTEVVPRLVNVLKANGSDEHFTYCELSVLNQKFIEEIMDADDSGLIDLFDTISNSPFISGNVDRRVLKGSLEDFKELDTEEKRSLLIETLDSNMLYVNLSDIDDPDYSISDDDRQFTFSFYNPGA